MGMKKMLKKKEIKNTILHCVCDCEIRLRFNSGSAKAKNYGSYGSGSATLG
jgi:hypothetical protein